MQRAVSGGSGWQRSAGTLQCLFSSADNYCSNCIGESARPPAAYKHHLQNTRPFRTVPACSCGSVKHCGRAPNHRREFFHRRWKKQTVTTTTANLASQHPPLCIILSTTVTLSEDSMVFIVCIKMLCKDTSVMGNVGDDNGSIDRTNLPQSGLRSQ